MKNADKLAHDLLTRLLAGEGGLVELDLAMLLEKSWRLDRGDDPHEVEAHYRELHLPNLAGVRLSSEASKEIVTKLCAAVSRDPKPDLVAASASTGSELAVKTMVQVLLAPPRPLALSEAMVLISHLSPLLAIWLAKDPKFLPKADLERLAELAKKLQNTDESEPDRAAKFGLKHHTGHLLRSLARLGIVDESPTPSAVSDAVSDAEADLAIRTAAEILINPPHALTVADFGSALSTLAEILPDRLERKPDLLPRAQLERLAQLANQLQHLEVEEGKTDKEKAKVTEVQFQAGHLLLILRLFDVIPS